MRQTRRAWHRLRMLSSIMIRPRGWAGYLSARMIVLMWMRIEGLMFGVMVSVLFFRLISKVYCFMYSMELVCVCCLVHFSCCYCCSICSSASIPDINLALLYPRPHSHIPEHIHPPEIPYSQNQQAKSPSPTPSQTKPNPKPSSHTQHPAPPQPQPQHPSTQPRTQQP